MKKFFLFRREEDSIASGESVSNSGEGVSTIAIAADNLSYMTTKLGGVEIIFNGTSAFESTFLRKGESLPKTKIEVSCKEGEETLLMESILNFISSESKKNVMRFDNVARNSTFSSFDDTKKPKVVVPTLAVETATGNVSEGSEEDQYQNQIAGINFFGNLPDIDFNHEGLSGFADTATVSSWHNAGKLGSAYSISSVNNTPDCVDPASRDRGLNTKSVGFLENEYMTVPSFSVDEEYILYLVWTTQYTDTLFNQYLYPMYGDGDGETTGPGGKFPYDGAAEKVILENGRISIRHDGLTSFPATVKASKEIPQIIQVGSTKETDIPCHVLVIRRDSSKNIFVYDRDGEVVATLPGGIRDNRGPLLIERLGTTNEVETNSFNKGSIARFGVISKDPGADFAATLAQNLFNFYHKP